MGGGYHCTPCRGLAPAGAALQDPTLHPRQGHHLELLLLEHVRVGALRMSSASWAWLSMLTGVVALLLRNLLKISRAL